MVATKTSKAIWKFMINITDTQEIPMPIGAEILTVQSQCGTPCLWARVSPGFKKENRTIIMIGTGHSIRHETGRYIGTFQIDNGALVFHVFEGKEK